MRWILAAALFATFPALMSAQHVGPARFSGNPGFRGAHFHRGGYYPLGFFDYGNYLSDARYPSPAQPQVIVLQAPQPAPAVEPAPPPSQPLMIELQGDHYVQISGNQPSPDQRIDSSSTAERVSELSTSGRPTLTVTLIFRDGHRQQVSAYTIAGGTLYASSDYATTGSWNQKIELSALNVPETIAANEVSGHRFQIPSAPNEVIVGP